LTARGNLNSGDLVAIYGCGGVGLSAVAIAKAFGAKVAAVDVNEIALENARQLGADFLLQSEVAVSEIQSLGGADISVDALGSQVTAELSIKSLRRLGKHIQLGLLLSESGLTPIAMARVIAWELEIIGSHGMAARDYPAMLSMIESGKLDPSKFIKKRITLEEAPKALQEMDSQIQDGITIIHP
jgi:alcohol dehydrogenase